MKVLVTGATGYLGSHLARRLLQEGYDIAAYKLPSSSFNRLGEIANSISWYNFCSDNLALPFQKHGHFDAVIHIATCYGRNNESYPDIFKSNTELPVHLLDAAIRFKTPTFINTDTALDPRLNIYALTKNHFAEWGRMVANLNRSRYVNVQLEHIYGAGDSTSKFTTHIVRQCLRNVPVIPLTTGEQERDFIHIYDAVEAYLALLKHQNELPQEYLDVGLGSGCPVSIRSFVELVYKLCCSTSNLDFGALPYRRHETMNSNADITLLRSLGWAPKFSLREGLEKMIAEERKTANSHEGIKG